MDVSIKCLKEIRKDPFGHGSRIGYFELVGPFASLTLVEVLLASSSIFTLFSTGSLEQDSCNLLQPIHMLALGCCY